MQLVSPSAHASTIRPRSANACALLRRRDHDTRRAAWGDLTKLGLNRYLRVTRGGLLRVDQAAIKAEERLDGKYLLRCSDPKLSAEDIALGYKQVLEVERGWRDMKTTLDLRLVYHRREDRIRAHILLCWLALLLIRIAETTTSHTWTKIRTVQGSKTLSPWLTWTDAAFGHAVGHHRYPCRYACSTLCSAASPAGSLCSPGPARPKM